MAGIYNKLKIAFGTGFGVGVSRLFNLLPVAGALDYTVTRSGTNATITNINGVVESVGADIPRADFSDFSCSTLLTEGVTTNLYLTPEILVTQNITTLNETYTVSFYGTGTITFSGTFVGSLVGTGLNDRVVLTFSATAGTLTSTITGTVTNGQAEEKVYSTSFVVGTRSKDDVTGAKDESFFNDDKGILFIHTYIFPDSDQASMFTIAEDDADNFRLVVEQSGTELKFQRFDGLIDTDLTYTPNSIEEFNKIALLWDFPRMELWVNGVLRDVSLNYTQVTGDILDSLNFHNGALVGDDNFKAKTLEVWYSDDTTIDLEIETSFVSLEDLVTNFQYTTI